MVFTSCSDLDCYPGFCDNSTITCICPEPYVNVGDFAPFPQQGCNINLIATKVLWGIQSAFWIYFTLSNILVISLIFIRKPVGRAFLNEQIILVIKSICATCLATVGILESTSTLASFRMVGIDFATTWVFCIGSTAFWMDILLFFLVQTSFNLIPLAISKAPTIAFIYNRLFPLCVFTSIVGTMSPLGLLYDSPEHFLVYIQLHFIILGILLFVLMFSFILAMNKILQEVRGAQLTRSTHQQNSSTAEDSQNSNQRRVYIEKRLREIELQVQNFRRDGLIHLLNGPVSILFGCVPYLTRRSSYFLPVIWTAGSIASIRYTMLAFQAVIKATQSKNTQVDTNHANANPLTSGSTHQEASQERVDSGGGSAEYVAPLGLGIMTRKFKKKKFKANMSRITEVSENRSQMTAAEPISYVDSSTTNQNSSTMH